MMRKPKMTMKQYEGSKADKKADREGLAKANRAGKASVAKEQPKGGRAKVR